MSHTRERVRGPVGVVAAVSLGMLGLAAMPANAIENQDGTVTVDVAAITDFHGHIENAAALAYQVDQMRKANPDTVFVGNGDLVGGSAYVSSVANDEPTLDILNSMRLEVSSLGNHEFDQGYADVKGRLAGRANWRYLVANVEGIDPKTTPPYHVIETASGVTVGFVGTVTDDLDTLVSPAGIEGLKATDPVGATDRYAAQLKDGDPANGEADVVVALMHEDQGPASKVGPNVDAVVAGHTHIDANAKTASGAPVIEPGSYGHYLGKIRLTYDKNAKKVTKATGENVKIGDYAKDQSVPVDAGILAMFKEAEARAKQLGAQQVGTIQGEALRGTNDGTDSGANRGTESSLGNLVAEGFYEHGQSLAKKPDFGIMNAGGLRADLDPNKDGVVTYEESFSVQPFGNAYATVELTSAQIHTLLEQQWNKDPKAARPVLRLGLSKNISYIYDPKAPVGSKITSVILNGKALERSDTATRYTVASNNFLLKGGDGYEVFKEADVTATYQDTGLIDNDVFNSYLKAHPGLTIDYSQRSVGVTGPKTLRHGERAVFELSSLVFTNGEPKPGKVTMSLPDPTVTADIDPTVTPNVDETGRATISFVVPANVSLGFQPILIEAGETQIPFGVFYEKAPANVFLLGDKAVSFGRSDDVPLVGDWDGDGKDTPAVKRGNQYFLVNSYRGGAADFSFHFGRSDDVPLVGDWDGDGKDTIAVRRGNDVYVKNALAGGAADVDYKYGLSTDAPIAGDFDGDGKDTVAVRRDGESSTYFVNNRLSGGAADYSFELGAPGDKAVTGKWTAGAAFDAVSFVRDGQLHVNAQARPDPHAVLPTVPVGGTDASTYFAGVFSDGGLDKVGFRG